MGIFVGCRCGQAFEADLWLAGKVVQCPACNSPIVVPSPPAQAEAPTYVPRPRPFQSTETRELSQSVATFIVAGVVILMIVIGISIGIVLFIKSGPVDPLASLPAFPTTQPNPGNTSSLPATGELIPATPEGDTPLAPGVNRQPSPLTPLSSTGNIPSGWMHYEHPSARFTVILPDPPEVIQRTVEDVREDAVYHVLTATQSDHVFAAARTFRGQQIPPQDEAAIFDTLASVRADEIGGSILRSENLVQNGRQVRDLILQGEVEGSPVRKYMRLIIHGNSIFELSCQVPTGKERAGQIGAFLSNYRVE